MKTSETLGKLFEALTKAQAEFPVIPKNKKVKVKTKSGNDYEYWYADLADIISATKPALTAQGLTVSQGPSQVDGKLILVTMLGHVSGEYISYHYPIKTFADAQDEGSELTYKRRYALSAAIGIQSEEDDDGKRAVQPEAATANKSAPSNPTPKAAPRPAPQPVSQPSQPSPLCRLCGTAMKISAKGDGMYCPNFRNNDGEHSRFPKKDLAKYLAEQSKVPEHV